MTYDACMLHGKLVVQVLRWAVEIATQMQSRLSPGLESRQ